MNTGRNVLLDLGVKVLYSVFNSRMGICHDYMYLYKRKKRKQKTTETMLYVQTLLLGASIKVRWELE